MKHFIVIDMQNGFVNGSLANPLAKGIVSKVKTELEKARTNGDHIIFTRDTHTEDYLNTLEGKYLPVKHCVEGTDDWQIIDELKPIEGETVINKPNFGYTAWDTYIKPGDDVVIVGTVTSICVVSNALAIKAIGEVEVSVIANCCADLNEVNHKAALTVMKSCQCQIK